MAAEYILQYWHPGNIYNTHFTKYFIRVCTTFFYYFTKLNSWTYWGYKISSSFFFEVHLHWAKAHAKANFVFNPCRCSMRTLNWIFYEPIWKRCHFRFRSNINESFFHLRGRSKFRFSTLLSEDTYIGNKSMVVFTRYRRKVVNTTPVVVVYAKSCLLKLFCNVSNVLNYTG